MDDGSGGVQESSDMSISSDDDTIKQLNESNVELEHDDGEAQPDALLGDPKLGMTFDTENEVREYYNNYAKAKGFGVTRRSSNNDDNGQLKCLTHSLKMLDAIFCMPL
ncbi:hypothetical protein VPH35_098925 [Triticum aestivum]|uniref:Protein FAR1-RELATED SEQUENCE n=1 Tax=Triticum aestivum TaxID=4565 RepID=F5CPR2_WHEAT|nr:hypothetical protein TAANSRALLhA_260E13.g00001 [Triticum aestivum]